MIQNNFLDSAKLLNEFIANKKNFENIESAAKLMLTSINAGAKIISCGNGGSMSDAMHFAEELSGRFKEDRRALPAIAICDPSHITCVGNDYGFDYIFSRFIEALGHKNDVLLAISTSGNSTNIVQAIIVAKKIGMKVVALTGKDGGKIKDLCDIEIRVPYYGYSDRIQEIHIKIIHSIIDYIEQNLS